MSGRIVTLAGTARGQPVEWSAPALVWLRALALVEESVWPLPCGAELSEGEARDVGEALGLVLEDVPDLSAGDHAAAEVRALAAILRAWADGAPPSRRLLAFPPGVSILELCGGQAIKARLRALAAFLRGADGDVAVTPPWW